MFKSEIRHRMSGKYLYGLILLLAIAVICGAFSINSTDDFDFARREVLLRRIGHELLLQSGDSTSRVLPVQKLSQHEYQVSFEQALSFQPDSLVNITRRLLANAPHASDYIVNVLNCGNASVAYGFAISENKKDDIVTCIGRKQPRACYKLNIKFKAEGINTTKNGFLLACLAFLAFAGFIIMKFIKRPGALPEDQPTGMLALGAVLFDANHRKLIIDGNTIELTGTETRILNIFALSPNETIERNRLQKEIWEDEGVIVGRSLDMFISKLRKKLEADPTINIVVIRGKGYKLEINT